MSLDHTEATTEQPRLLPASLEDRLVNWIGRIGGAALLLAITLIWLSLLTWSVGDPSLTHATSGKAQNGLGALGAIVSDLFLQMLGFGTAIALLAPMLWGLELLASDRVPGFRTKASFYPLSVLALSGAFSALPVSPNWPLHHGLGGILGDLLHGVGFGFFSVINPERASLATGFMLLVIGASALAYSVGLDMKDLSNLVEGQRRRKPAATETAEVDAASKPAKDGRRSRWLVGFWSRRKDEAGSEPAPQDTADVPAEAGHEHDPHLSGYDQAGQPYGAYEDQRWHGQQHPGWGGAPYSVDAYGRPYDPYAYDPSAAPGNGPVEPGYAGYGQPGAYAPAVSPQLPPQHRDGVGQEAQPQGWHAQDWANRDWSQMPTEPHQQSPHSAPGHSASGYPVPVYLAPGHAAPGHAAAGPQGHLGPRGGEGGLAHARGGAADRHEPDLPGFGQDGRRRTDGAPYPRHPAAHPGHNPYAAYMGRTRRPAHDADAAGRDPGFDHLTDAASRDIAERFAPGAASDGAGKERPTVTSDTGGATRKPGGGLLAGLGFRRAEPQFKRPSLNMLKRAATGKPGNELTQTVLRGNARLLEDVLGDFGVKGEVRDIKPGPVVTLFEVEPARGTKSSRVIGLADDIARSMSANAVRVAVVPGRNAIGIELPNARREGVLLREILETESFRSGESLLPLALGKSIGGEPVVADLARMPHLLVAGTTGSGKSVGINAFVLSLLYRHAPEDCRLLMIDPKMLELSVYNGIPHLLTPVVTDPVKAVAALNWAVSEMEERYKRMAKLSVRNIDVYNNRVRNAKKRGELIHRSVQTGFDKRGQAVYEKEQLDLEPMPYIVIVVDEFADLMIVAGKEIEGAVQRLAQMARAAGIHLIMATQRPSVDIITGTIKANFPTRISFKVASKIDSRTILNDQGAEQLLGQGDMLYSTGSGQAVRVHGPFVSDEEVENIARFLREQGVPRYIDGITEPAAGAGPMAAETRGGSDDDLYDRAVAIVLRDRKPSTSYVQRRLSIGYNRAADLIERMEREGLISPPNGTGRREILAAAGGADAAE